MPLPFPCCLSVRVNERRQRDSTATKRVAYLVDLHTVAVVDLISGVTMATFSHDSKVNWIEVSVHAPCTLHPPAAAPPCPTHSAKRDRPQAPLPGQEVKGGWGWGKRVVGMGMGGVGLGEEGGGDGDGRGGAVRRWVGLGEEGGGDGDGRGGAVRRWVRMGRKVGGAGGRGRWGWGWEGWGS